MNCTHTASRICVIHCSQESAEITISLCNVQKKGQINHLILYEPNKLREPL